MESENVHHQQQQQQHQLVGSPPSSLPNIPSCYGVASSHSWTPTHSSFTLNSNEFNPNYNGASILNSSRQKQDMLASSHYPQTSTTSTSSMIQHWSTTATNINEIKEEQLSELSLTRFTEMLSDTATTTTSSSSVGESHPAASSCYLKNDDDEQQQNKDLHDLSHKLLLKTISSGFPMFSSEFCHNNYSNINIPAATGFPSRGNFSQIYPSINISSLNQASNSPNIMSTTSTFDMNLEALDLLSTARFSRSNSFTSSHDHHHHDNNLGLYKDISPPFGIHHHLHQSNQRATYSPPNKPLVSEITEAKRPSALPEPKATGAGVGVGGAKKSRLDSSRASCPPFKVRKEKLGDRIAALQQLVAPFGKTDTASVLMEAIGYIKFLQNQVETLSVPYMKACRNNKACRANQGGSTMQEDGNEEARRDLRSRGLCLVPLSCMSYMTNDTGGGIWPPPPNFAGGT